MADQISIQIPKTTYKEGSAFTATVNFRDRATATASTPTTVEYRVFNKAIGQAVKSWTAVSAASTVSITLDAGINRLRRLGGRRERLNLIVLADRGLPTEIQAKRTYTIADIQGDVTADVSTAANVTIAGSDRSVRAPESDTNPDMLLPIAGTRAEQLLGFDANGNVELYAQGSGGGGTTLSRQIIGGYIWPITTAEVSAGITPTDLAWEPGNPNRYGADPTGVADSATAIQTAIDSDHEVNITPGDYLIQSTLVITRAKTINLAGRGIGEPYAARYPSRSGLVDVETEAVATLFVDSDIHFFRLAGPQIWIYGGNYSVVGVNGYSSRIFWYDIANQSDHPRFTEAVNPTQAGRPQVWGGGILDFFIIGDYETFITDKTDDAGAYGIYVDFDNGAGSGGATESFGYVTATRWRGQMKDVHTAVYLGPQDVTANQFANNIDVDVEVDGFKNGLVNYSFNNSDFKFMCQARGVITPNEWAAAEGKFYCIAHMDSTYCRNNNNEAIGFDLGAGTADGNGLYKPMHKWFIGAGGCTIDVRSNVDLTPVLGTHKEAQRNKFIAPVGFIPKIQRSVGNGTQGMFQSGFENLLVGAHKKGTVVVNAYQGRSVTTTAVSDAVFANQSGVSVDITSALGALPTMVVNSRFTVTDHSQAANNNEFIVTAVITDGYTCDKVSTVYIDGQQIADPVDAVSEAINVDTQYGNITTDSVTASVPTSSDITLTNTDGLFDWDSIYATAIANATAVTDGDYIEIHISGFSYRLAFLWLHINDSSGGWETVQVIRRASGVVQDNIIEPYPNGNPMTPTTWRNANPMLNAINDEIIIRLIGHVNTSIATFWDIAGAHDYSDGGAPILSILGDKTVYGHLTMGDGGGIVERMATTAQLQDISHAINTGPEKRLGFKVYNTTTKTDYCAQDANDNGTWIDTSDGSTTLTPV